MLRITKISLRLAAIFIPIGILFIIVGIFTGAKRNVNIGTNGKILIDQEQTFDYENDDITDVNNIKIDIHNAKILINQSNNDKFMVKVKLYSVSEDPVNIQNGTLEIIEDEGSKFGIHFFNWDFRSLFDGESNEVIIEVPRGISLDDVNLETSNGRIEIKNLTVNTLKADTSNGSITLEDVVTFDETALSTNNGPVNISGQFHESTYVKTSNGRIISNGTFNGKTTFKTSNGSITCDNNINRKDCDITADTSNGTIRIDEAKVGDDYKEDNNADNSIHLDTSNGGISLNFK